MLRTVQNDDGQFAKVKFGDICRNVAIRVDNPKEAGTDYYVGLEHLEPSELKIKRHGSPNDIIGTKLRFKSGQILFGKRRFYQKKLAIAECDGICSAHMLVLEAISGKILASFLPLLMQSDVFYQKAIMISEGSLSPTIKWKNLAKQEFLTPSEQIQQKIVNLISNIDDSITKTQHLLDKLRTYQHSKADDLLTRGIGHTKFKKVKTLFGKEIKMPEEWNMVKLDELVIRLASGGTPSTSNPDFWNGDIPWTRSSVLTQHYTSKGEKFITRQGLADSSSIIIPKNNLLIASRVSVGNVSINTIDISISQDITGIIINKEKIHSEFLYWYFLQYVQKLILLSQGTTIQGFTRQELSRFLIKTPSLAEQQKIASILSNIDEQTKQLKAHLSKLKKLRMSVINEKLTPPKTEDKIVQ